MFGWSGALVREQGVHICLLSCALATVVWLVSWWWCMFTGCTCDFGDWRLMLTGLLFHAYQTPPWRHWNHSLTAGISSPPVCHGPWGLLPHTFTWAAGRVSCNSESSGSKKIKLSLVCYRGREVKRAGNLSISPWPLAAAHSGSGICVGRVKNNRYIKRTAEGQQDP